MEKLVVVKHLGDEVEVTSSNGTKQVIASKKVKGNVAPGDVIVLEEDGSFTYSEELTRERNEHLRYIVESNID